MWGFERLGFGVLRIRDLGFRIFSVLFCKFEPSKTMSCYRVLFIGTIISPNKNLLGQVDWGLGSMIWGVSDLKLRVWGSRD